MIRSTRVDEGDGLGFWGWLSRYVLIDIVRKMNHFSLLLLLQSFFGKSQELVLSRFDGSSPPFGFGISHMEGG